MSSHDLAISVRNLSKVYSIGSRNLQLQTFGEAVVERLRRPLRRKPQQNFWALKDISFDVKKGEVVGIIGRNGAGKSTLLKVLSRITEPTAGRIKLFGRIGSLLEVGTGFHPELTGRENIYLNGAILGMSRAEIRKQFDAIVDFAEVERFLDTPVKRYSSGMYVRLAFAVAAHLDPEILVIDEVLAVGDMQFHRKCLGKMSEVARAGRTVLFVSHNMAAVRQLCTAALLLTEGRCIVQGTVQDCMQLYLKREQHKEAAIARLVRHFGDRMRVEDVAINGERQSVVNVGARDQILTIDINGTAKEPVRFDMEMRVFDSNDVPLGFFSPGHESGISPVWSAGPFHLRRRVRLPRMNRGEYILQIELAESGVATYASIDKSVTLRTEGVPTSTGLTFEYSKGNGWLLLSAEPDGFAGEEPCNQVA